MDLSQGSFEVALLGRTLLLQIVSKSSANRQTEIVQQKNAGICSCAFEAQRYAAFVDFPCPWSSCISTLATLVVQECARPK